MKERFFFSSHSLESLGEVLLNEVGSDHTSFFSDALIVIPHSEMKEWLQMRACRRSETRSVLGLEFVSWEVALLKLAGALPIPTRACLRAALWQEKKKLDIVDHLTNLFWDYFLSGFPKEVPEEVLWQKKLFEKIFQAHSWKTLPEALGEVRHRDMGPLYLFGLDSLPTAVHRFFLRYPMVNVFRFSPTSMFWEDLRLVDTLHPLSKWGSLGRKMLADASAFSSQEKEDYEVEGESNLQRLKTDFLLLEKQEFLEECPSIECLRTGSSKLQEVEALKITLMTLAEEGIPLSEIRVYAPDIGPYVPLIEFCFGETIPFRIRGVDRSRKSPFYQAVTALFRCVHGRWEEEEILSLFERAPFYQKAKWKPEDVNTFREWIALAKIKWGLDKEHRLTTTQVVGTIEEKGSWKTGFNTLFDAWIFLQPDKEDVLSWQEGDLFQQFYEKFTLLRQTLLSWKEERTLKEWADVMEQFVYSILLLDEADSTFIAFLDLLRKLALEFPSELFSFSFVETYFSTYPEEVGKSLLHAVPFASLEPGALLPARVVYMLGMDEESFPRTTPPSSLRLLTEQPSAQEWDRYLFLQALFAAKERLIFSYSHQSKEDGKTVNPSLLIQELFHHLGCSHFKTVIPPPPTARPFSFLTNSTEIPPLSTQTTLSIQELTRFFSRPFHHYLKTFGLIVKEETPSPWQDFQLSGLDRYLALRDALTGDPTLDLPPALFGEAAKANLEENIDIFKKSLLKWSLPPTAIETRSFKETESPLKLTLNGQSILLVGEAPLTVPSGVLHMGRDEVGGYLRKWPELLCSLIANQTHRIYSLKTGKVREVADPVAALQSVVELYLRAQHHLFFLHPEWADDILRKNRVPEEYLEECDDPVTLWALKRSPEFSLSVEQSLWKETLAKAFSPLTTLFERGHSGEV